MTKSPKQRLQKRLDGYWRMELANVLLVPLSFLIILISLSQRVGVLSLVSMVPMAGLLVIGGFYWKAKATQLRDPAFDSTSTLSLIDRLQLVLLVGSVLVSIACLIDLTVFRISVSTGDRVIGIICSVLAVLEYVNYYHRQLQHFDHLPDLQRLMKGQGFRPSQMSVDLARFRASRSSRTS